MPVSSQDQSLQAALRFHEAGDLLQAERLYRQILDLNPDHAEALHLLGVLAHQAHQDAIAVDLISRSIALAPRNAASHFNLGNIQRAMGKLDSAIASFQKALELDPELLEARINLGLALKDAGRFDDAIAAYRQALALKPDNARVWNSLGNALLAKASPDEAIDAYRQALRLRSDYPEARNNLGIALKAIGALDEAILCYREALALNPDSASFHSNLIFTLPCHPDYDSAAIARELRSWNQRHAAPLKPFILPHQNSPAPERPLRIGYVSPDFRSHAAACFLVPLLQSHDHRLFRIHCYSSVARPDAITQRLSSLADVWRDVHDCDDARLADMIRSDQIDILVDLTMHMGQNRLLLFARKPAPIQVTWLAYPGSTGMDAIDYRITDPFLDPPDRDESVYSETSIRLPESFWCYNPLAAEPPVKPLPARKTGCITFGSLNNPCKINDTVLRLWAQVLNAVPGSRLLLLGHEGSYRRRVLDLLQTQGIDPSRVAIAGYRPRPLYLQLYHQIDLGLDTFPYNGHTTSFDSFWMGVPVVTLTGKDPVSRAGLCALMNLGLPDLVARTPEQFVQIATSLANDLPRLETLRSSLRTRMEVSPLMNAPRFARHMEEAYRAVWRKWCAQHA